MDDFNNEMAGRDVGRMGRFLPSGERDPKKVAKQREERAAMLTNLQILMQNDPEYAALYRETEEKLRDAQSRLDTALDKVQQLKAGTEEAMLDIMNRAARLPDGRAVFQDQDGNVRYEDGTAVDTDLAESIVWRGDEPKLAELEAAANRMTDLLELENSIHAGQAEIGDMQERMADQRDPTAKDGMTGFQNRAGELVARAEERVEYFTRDQSLSSNQEAVARPTLNVAAPEI
ncbi:hypothetical protein [Leisingera sp. M658]|uniref:hypothetical protein n=1 Tax=Leisingera sp. M658 TaxID=2867015 RepID=UPI0021A4BDEE|nr:hypothetical protein [Leisingera sp. M658]UWQ73601.1 hypothetical protein K3724_13705 [Leisingera sp. M658]